MRRRNWVCPPCEKEADAAWSEFDLDHVYPGIAQKLTELHGGDESAAVNRRWSPADEMVVRAWVGGEVELIVVRVRRVVFTSATPIAISAGDA